MGNLIQNTSGNYSTGYDPGNPLAVYQCRLVVVDVDGPGDAPGAANGYGPLSTFTDFTITLKPAEVNAGAKTPITECVVDPSFSPGYNNGFPTQIYRSNFDNNMLSQNGFDKALPWRNIWSSHSRSPF